MTVPAHVPAMLVILIPCVAVGVLIYVLMSLHTKIDENAELIEQDMELINDKDMIIKDNVIGTMV